MDEKPFNPTAEEAKQKRVKKIMDDAAKKLEKEGVKYFVGVVDRQPQATDGGKVYTQLDATGEDFIHILDVALPTRQDAINLGIWVGQILNARNPSNLKK